MEYFGRCYEICSQLDNAAALYSARVQYGIAKGHQFMGNFSSFMTDTSADSLQQLVVWKDARIIPSTSDIQQEEKGEGKNSEEINNPQVAADSTNEHVSNTDIGNNSTMQESPPIIDQTMS